MDSAWRLYFCCLLPLALCFFAVALRAEPPMPATPSPEYSAPSPESTPNYIHSREMTSLLHWPRFPLRVFFSPTSYANADRRGHVLAGFDEWVQATQGSVRYRVVTEEAQADLTVTIASQVNLPKYARALGQTTLTYTGTQLSKAVIQIVVRDDDPARFQEISAHEFGHALGINGHSDNPDDMMFPILSHSLFQVENYELEFLSIPGTVTTRDVNTLKSAYPASLFPSKKH